MRRRPSTMPLLVASIISSSVAMADTVPADLGPGEVRAHLKRVDAAIGACYLGAIGDRVGAGKLEVVLSIHRKGLVDHVDVNAPGLPAKLVSKIDGCVRAALAGITFPARRIGTTAVVPYFWQKTAAVDAGPQQSCWDPNGCKDGEPQHVAQQKKRVTNQARRAPRS
jgi:hypothetical protein